MKQYFKKIFTIIAIALVFSTSAFAMAEEQITDTNTVTTPPPVEIQTKKPIRKRDLAMKFVMAMLGVVASSVTIYVLLSVYNKLMYGSTVQKTNEAEDNKYKTSTNMKEAINIFLKKTK